MFTYQVRNRYFKLTAGQKPSFPSNFEAIFTLKPLQPFGNSGGEGRTGVKGVGASAYFNANTGHHFIESKVPLRPLNVVIEESNRRVEFLGNELRISGRIETLGELEETLLCIFFGLPILLNVELADPPVVERVEGKVGEASFRWELADWRLAILLTTQDEQEDKVAISWSRFNVLAKPGNRRLIAALHYFHVFCRLCRAGQTPWEFMAEAIMNLSKILEVLFPPPGDGQTIVAARAGLVNLGYSEDDIERDFIPAIALRSNIDSAHVDLSLFNTSQLRVLHSYTEAAEMAFRELLSKVMRQIEAGSYQVTQHAAAGHDSRTAKIIERLAKYFGNPET